MTGNLILFNKPYGVLSQFTGEADNLSRFAIPPHYYVAGRLDKDSEGLLLLTNSGALQAQISHPRFKMRKHYWAQIEGEISESSLAQFRQGIALKDGKTKPAQAKPIQPQVPERIPPIRQRQSIPDQWLEVILREGKNRQVRRMTAALGHPTLRLIRVRIGEWTIDGLTPGQWRSVQVNLPREQSR